MAEAAVALAGYGDSRRCLVVFVEVVWAALAALAALAGQWPIATTTFCVPCVGMPHSRVVKCTRRRRRWVPPAVALVLRRVADAKFVGQMILAWHVVPHGCPLFAKERNGVGWRGGDSEDCEDREPN